MVHDLKSAINTVKEIWSLVSVYVEDIGLHLAIKYTLHASKSRQKAINLFWHKQYVPQTIT